MGLIPAEAKAALAYLKSIDKSLGRIATALEKQNEYNDNPILKYISTGGDRIGQVEGGYKNDDSNKGSTIHVVQYGGESDCVSRG